MSRPSMRYVAVKTVEQQDIQAVHRVRASLIGERTAKANQLRGLVYEYGLVARREIASLRRAVPALAGGCDERAECSLQSAAGGALSRPAMARRARG